LRKELRIEFGLAAKHIVTLMLELDDEPPVEEHEQALKALDAARALLSDIGPISDQPPADIELDLSSNALLVLKVLERQHNTEVDRLHERAHYGPIRDVAREEVQTLGDFVMVVKEHVQQQRKRLAEHSPAQSHPGTSTRAHRKDQYERQKVVGGDVEGLRHR
jgi:hypothetical protein